MIAEEPVGLALDDARYVAFGGCGCKGVVYLGALRALQRHNPRHAEWHRALRGACGSSSGCIAALAFLVNADAVDLLARWRALNIQSFVPYMDLHGVFTRYGMDGGELVRRVVREVFAACGLAHDTTTFATLFRLTGRDLRICVTNLSRGRLEVFSHETTPDVLVARAMYWSMCVPFVFEPESYLGDVMVDGCLLAYVPYEVWPLEESIVFHAVGEATGAGDDAPRRDIPDLRAFAAGVMACAARSVLRDATRAAAAHPSRFVRIVAHESAHDVVLNMDGAAFQSLVDLGFATMLQRVRPDVAETTRCVVGVVAAVASAVGREAAAHEDDKLEEAP